MMIENCHNGGPAGNTPHYDEKGELQVRSFIICTIRSKNAPEFPSDEYYKNGSKITVANIQYERVAYSAPTTPTGHRPISVLSTARSSLTLCQVAENNNDVPSFCFVAPGS